MKYFAIGFILSVYSFFTFFKDSKQEKLEVKPPFACESLTGIDKVVCLCEAFKSSLNATQLAAVQRTYSKTDAVKWSNLPQALTQTKRVGLQTNSLSTAQWAALKELLKAVTGSGTNEGLSELESILAADDYLLANGGGSTYGSGNYFIAFLGTPSATSLWELQFGGHHYAFANTYLNGKLIGATPSFRASEPSGVFSYSGNTYQPVLQEKAAFVAVVNSLSTTEAATAKATSSFSDILLGPGKDSQFPTTKSGLKVGTLNQSQKDLVLAAINTYVSDLDSANAAFVLNKYKSELDETYILYSGTGTMETKADYFRIDGPNVWIEYSTQGGIVIKSENHPHSVWRDRSGDYGGTATGTTYLPQFAGKFEIYPNPIVSTTNFSVTLDESSDVSFTILDMTGKVIYEIPVQQMGEGKQSIPFNANQLAAGYYQCKMAVKTDKGTTYAIRPMVKS